MNMINEYWYRVKWWSRNRIVFFILSQLFFVAGIVLLFMGNPDVSYRLITLQLLFAAASFMSAMIVIRYKIKINNLEKEK